jgi:hypothetical protein
MQIRLQENFHPGQQRFGEAKCASGGAWFPDGAFVRRSNRGGFGCGDCRAETHLMRELKERNAYYVSMEKIPGKYFSSMPPNVRKTTG